ncbi:hypothetical protein P43SY_007773 [Pythium insidiosum]|uniref:Kinesin-like protein n=1 Tax=Pythium insidiosum TaxID=114742 RepID=A0AAD5LEN6_PYTIN|nr:hypothetical protein P43SY_007773 [Pythium insidiosum]
MTSREMELPRRIRVVVRVRPRLAREKTHACGSLQVDTQRHVVRCTARSFQFDQVFDGGTAQDAFFEQLQVGRMLDAVLDGYHATIFAYGQTGSGKTFTMEGYDYERPRDNQQSSSSAPQARVPTGSDTARIGLIPRTIRRLFARIDELSCASTTAPREFNVKCSFLQIYNEQVLDLLNPAHFLHHGRGSKPSRASRAQPGLRLRWTAQRDFYVENLCVLECSSPEQVLQHFQDGVKHKIMASHNLNAASSRSHCVFTLYVESASAAGSASASGDGDSHVLHSKLALVDLAGSERVDKTGATGVTLQESIGINKSLFVLRQVIQALSEDSSDTADARARAYIPYRDSKLTSLLKYSLGGNSWTLMIACLSPSDAYVDENLSTLVYASKAQSIANHPTKNEDPKTLLIQELRREVESLRAQLAQAQEVILQFQRLPSSSATTEMAASVPEVETEATPKAETQTPTVEKTQGANDTAAATTKLKLSVIDNVEMIKRLYATEKELRSRLTSTEATVGDLRHENRVLHVENQSLREKMEVLEYLVAHASPQEDADPEGRDDVQEIPEYGALAAPTSANELSIREPPAERIREVLRKSVGGRGNNKVAPSGGEAVAPHSQASRRQEKKPPRPEKETGLLSLSELRDLLSGKKASVPASVSQAVAANMSRSRKESRSNQASGDSARPTTAAPEPFSDRAATPTVSLLTTLQQQVQPVEATEDAGKDPLESLSELNRLLRVKAQLRRSSSFR